MWHARALITIGNFLFAFVICAALITIPDAKPVRAYDYTWWVNDLGDEHDADYLDGVCETAEGNGVCTLRAAIESAFQNELIDFSVTGTISLHETLVITRNEITIDGSSDGITISGASLSPDEDCMRIGGNTNVIQFLTIRDCMGDGIYIDEYADNSSGDGNTLSNLTILGINSAGIFLNDGDMDGYGGSDNVISYNLIGYPTISPTSCLPSEGTGSGITILSNAHSNQILHNWVYCSDGSGIVVSSADSNFIHGNTIGGNLYSGIAIQNANHITVEENFIGNQDGLVAFGNGRHGIIMDFDTHDITIGGSSISKANIISGNGWSGIFISDGAYGLTINNNNIGLNAAQDAALPNGQAGIAIQNNLISTSEASAIVIGDDDYLSSHQYISGNTREGLYIADSNNVRIKDSNLIGRGNFGTNPGIPVGNGLEGVKLFFTSGITVGGYAIAYNGAAGVTIEGDDKSLRNLVTAQ